MICMDCTYNDVNAQQNCAPVTTQDVKQETWGVIV